MSLLTSLGSCGPIYEPYYKLENFQWVLEMTLSVLKEELDGRRAEYERKREQEKRAG
jgi:hypothetical protein